MEFFRIRRDIPFMRHALVLNAISALTFLAAVFFLVTKGLHLSVEFTGGTVMEISYQQAAPLNTIRADLNKLGYEVPWHVYVSEVSKYSPSSGKLVAADFLPIASRTIAA